MEKGLGHFFITSRCSHFVNKTDFEQFLFKGNEVDKFQILDSNLFSAMYQLIQLVIFSTFLNGI